MYAQHPKPTEMAASSTAPHALKQNFLVIENCFAKRTLHQPAATSLRLDILWTNYSQKSPTTHSRLPLQVHFSQVLHSLIRNKPRRTPSPKLYNPLLPLLATGLRHYWRGHSNMFPAHHHLHKIHLRHNPVGTLTRCCSLERG